ncbi:MAG TPA: flagellar hook-associated protein FlgL [Candidatus Aquilonibacter sp.]|nr:flagellar hook-associated protein FlgL [Candidatus Aquilonibacter sp.]
MSSVRVNPNLASDLLAGINTVREELNQSDLEIASGKSINTPSDNPGGAAALVINLAEQSQTDTYQANAADLQTRLQTADSVLGSAVTAITSAISAGVEAGNSDLSTDNRDAIANQVAGIQQQLVSLANTTSGGTYLFSGTLVETQPFALDSASPSGVTYSGNSGVTSVQLSSGQSLATNLPGSQLFLNPSGNVFQSINQLILAIQNNSGISTAVTNLGQALQEFNSQRQSYGTALNQLQSTGNLLASEQVQLASQQSNISAADLPTAVTNFSQSEIAYTSLLEAEGKVLNLPNLLSFLQ